MIGWIIQHLDYLYLKRLAAVHRQTTAVHFTADDVDADDADADDRINLPVNSLYLFKQ